MNLLDEDDDTITTFIGLSASDTSTLDASISAAEFQLGRADQQSKPFFKIRARSGHAPVSAALGHGEECQRVRPFEFKILIGAVFLILQLAALVTFLVLFIRARQNHGE